MHTCMWQAGYGPGSSCSVTGDVLTAAPNLRCGLLNLTSIRPGSVLYFLLYADGTGCTGFKVSLNQATRAGALSTLKIVAFGTITTAGFTVRKWTSFTSTARPALIPAYTLTSGGPGEIYVVGCYLLNPYEPVDA